MKEIEEWKKGQKTCVLGPDALEHVTTFLWFITFVCKMRITTTLPS